MKEKEDAHLNVKQEEDPVDINSYGSSKKKSPGGLPSPLYSQTSTPEEMSDHVQIKEEDLNIVVVDPDPIAQAQNDNAKVKNEEFSSEINTDTGLPRTITAFKMRNINVQELIRAVEEHPELYDSSLASYSDCYKKKEAWVDVTRRVTPHWHSMSKKERELQERQLKIRWKSLRDRFKRDLNALGTQRSGSAGKKIKIHRFFEKLQFLKVTMQTRKTSGNVKEESEESLPMSVDEATVLECAGEEEATVDQPLQQPEYSTTVPVPTQEIPLQQPPQQRGRRVTKKKGAFPDPLSCEVMSVLGEMRDQLREARERDPARLEDSISNFLASLGEDMRRISPEYLPHVKFQLMQVVHQAIYASTTLSASTYPSSNLPSSTMNTDMQTPFGSPSVPLHDS